MRISVSFQLGGTGVWYRVAPFCSLFVIFEERKAIPFYPSFSLKLNAYEMAVCSSGHSSSNAGYSDPSGRAGGLLQPHSPRTDRRGGSGDESGLRATTHEPPRAPLSRAGYLDAADNQQLRPAPLSPSPIPTASARPRGCSSPPLSLLQNTFGALHLFPRCER